MRAPLSIVIPTLNVADRLGPCLGSLAGAVGEGLICEVILSDGGSDDEIADVAEAVGARLVSGPSGRGLQLAAGARAAKGEWLLFLHADSVPGPDWAAAVRAHMADHPDSAGFFLLRFDSTHPMAKLTAHWANLRARLTGLAYGDQGLLVSRALLAQSGGVPELPLMEDVALARRLRGRLRCIGTTLTTSAERYERNGWLRQGIGNLWRQVRFLCGARPERLAKGYERR